MKCGGNVEKEVKKCGGGAMKKGGKYSEGGKADLGQDKALIKKAFKQHDKAEHDKEPTEIKLKKGNRVKKEAGTVKKYKAGGAIEMKKSSGDLDTIKKVKATGAKKANAPSKAEVKPNFKSSDVEKEKSKPAGDKDAIKKVKPTGDKKADAPNKAAVKPNRKGINAIDDIDGYKKGGKIKHMADGGLSADAKANFPGRMTNMELEIAKQARAKQNFPGRMTNMEKQMSDGDLSADAKAKANFPGRMTNIERNQNAKGGHIKHMADGALTGVMPTSNAEIMGSPNQGTSGGANGLGRLNNIQQQMMKQRVLQAMLAAQAHQQSGMQGGQQAQQAGNPNAMNTTFNANQPPAYVNPTNAVMNNPYSRSGQNPQSVDALLNSPQFQTANQRTTDQ